MIKNYLYLLLVILISSCSSTNLMTLRVTEPAPIFITNSDLKIGIINRTAPSKGNESVDAIDKILSAEGKNLDKLGSNASVQGLMTELKKNEQVKRVITLDSSKFKNTGLAVFSESIPWDKAEKLCKDNNLNVIYELSFYDTDAKVDYKTSTTQIANPLGIKIPAIEHQATINTLIKMGWRIYYPQQKVMVDEYVANNNITLSGKGINPVRAVEAIIGRKEAVLNISDKIGQDYAAKLLPYYTRVSRDYYVKGTNNFEIGKRRAQTGDWDGAAELWAKETNNPDSKIAGRACYNMAIINEINGDLNKAIEWASKAYTDYGDKLGLRYVNMLKNRVQKQKLLESESPKQ